MDRIGMLEQMPDQRMAGLIGLALPLLKASIPQINALLRKYHLPTLPDLG